MTLVVYAQSASKCERAPQRCRHGTLPSDADERVDEALRLLQTVASFVQEKVRGRTGYENVTRKRGTEVCGN